MKRHNLSLLWQISLLYVFLFSLSLGLVSLLNMRSFPRETLGEIETRLGVESLAWKKYAQSNYSRALMVTEREKELSRNHVAAMEIGTIINESTAKVSAGRDVAMEALEHLAGSDIREP